MVEIEWYALRIVVELNLVNFTTLNLESGELNLGGFSSIPKTHG